MDFNPKIDLQVQRCSECHRYYANERHEFCRCPHCAEDRTRRLVDEIEELGRTISALKGVNTRLKNARKKRAGGKS